VKRRTTALLAAAAFFAGLSVNQVARAARRDGPYRATDVFSEVLGTILNNYVEEVPEKELVYAAVEGMVGRLDPHSSFMRPEVYKLMKEETTGEFDGVGIELSVRGDQMVVVSPIPDSPGERAGILPGDRILEIDGAGTRDMSLVEAVRKLKGPPGTKVVLKIQREGFATPQSLTLLRDHVRTQSVEWNLADKERGFAYVRIKGFQDRTDRALKKALDEARHQLGRELQGLVLDLRNNPGGLLEQAVRVSDRFLREGIIVTTEGRAKANREEERAKEKDTEPGYPLIVLVNRGSASASEIVAGALQDQGRAVILGTQTFGKGSVQTVIDLTGGAGLKLTVARYYTPKHRSIQELGVTPDVVVADAAPPRPPEDAGEKDLKRHLKGESATPLSPALEGDFQLKTALDYLRAAAILKAQPASAAAARP
jgi:carboxyl-terminal processing protease